MGYKKVGTKLDINNADFAREIILSKQNDQLTKKATDYFVKLANHAIRALPYTGIPRAASAAGYNGSPSVQPGTGPVRRSTGFSVGL